ncbi:hypothetical protein H5T58_00925 [Candidatus Parcubacteria bacterium]|nr:hypothetical protein [Candidatus Parcubacteria bacterium]
MDFLKKIQSLPEKKRKIILWVLVFLFAILSGFVFFGNFKQRLNKIQSQIQQVFQVKINEIQRK